MRVVVAFFLVVGFGMLWRSSSTGTVVWAWVAVGLSVAAIGALIADWRRKSAITVDATVVTAEREGTAEVFAHAVDGGGPHSAPVRSSPAESVGADSDHHGIELGWLSSGTGGGLPQEAERSTEAAELVGADFDQVHPGEAALAEPTSCPVDSDGAGGDSDEASRGVSDEIRAVDVAAPTQSARAEESPSVDRAGTNGSTSVTSGARQEDGSWFDPYRHPDRGAAESGDGSSAPSWVQSGGSDATVVFPRVHSDDGPGDGDADGAVPLDGVTAVKVPGEELADELALSVVAQLDGEVLVVDEQPRYHVAGCGWLEGRSTITLPAREAVELEFSPCELCAPVRQLSGGVSTGVEAVHPEDGRLRSRA